MWGSCAPGGGGPVGEPVSQEAHSGAQFRTRTLTLTESNWGLGQKMWGCIRNPVSSGRPQIYISLWSEMPVLIYLHLGILKQAAFLMQIFIEHLLCVRCSARLELEFKDLCGEIVATSHMWLLST